MRKNGEHHAQVPEHRTRDLGPWNTVQRGGHIERERPVWTATEHPSPTALHVIVARDLDALEQKITNQNFLGRLPGPAG